MILDPTTLSAACAVSRNFLEAGTISDCPDGRAGSEALSKEATICVFAFPYFQGVSFLFDICAFAVEIVQERVESGGDFVHERVNAEGFVLNGAATELGGVHRSVWFVVE